jgi:hypothetical protein
MAHDRGRDQGMGRGGETELLDEAVSGLPSAFLAAIHTSTPSAIAGFLVDHPTLRDAVFATVHRLHGNSFAQQVVAIAGTTRRKTPAEQRPEEANTAAPQHAPVAEAPAEPLDPQRQKILEHRKTANWEQMARGVFSERNAPDDLHLPASVVDAIDKAWQDSITGRRHMEQGGLLVRTYGGRYVLRRQPAHSPDGFEPDADDVGTWNNLAGIVHTHPYTDEESTRLGIDHGSFSATDLAAIVEENQPLNILRSGPYTYLIARTREFNALVKRHEASETTDDLKRSMFELHDTTFKSAKAPSRNGWKPR